RRRRAERGRGLPRDDRCPRRLRGGLEPCSPHRRSGPGSRRSGARDVPQARPVREGDGERARRGPGDGDRPGRARTPSRACPRGGGARMSARPLPEGFRPYAWAPPTAEIAARHGLHPAEIIRFDQNVPPLPGIPQVPLGESFARLNEYPDGTYRELREAAAVYAGVDAEQIVPGAGADGLIALA